jgi:hypothetical protein
MKKDIKKIFATLATITVQLPYKSEKDKKEADKMNKEIAHLGFQTYRAGYDWGYKAYPENYSTTDTDKVHPVKAQKLKSGDLVKVFKTISDGDVLWKGKVDFDRSDYHHGYQKNMSQKVWSRMFFDQLPAKLIRDGKTVHGSLEPFLETGTEGVIWSVQEYGKNGYDGLHCLQDGDSLEIFSTVKDGEVEWEGEVKFSGKKISEIDHTEVVRSTKHIDTEKWLYMSWDNRPAVIQPKR